MNDFFQDSVFGAFWALLLLLPRHSAHQADAEATSHPGRWGGFRDPLIFLQKLHVGVSVQMQETHVQAGTTRFVLGCLLYSLVLSALPLSGTIIRKFLNTNTQMHIEGEDRCLVVDRTLSPSCSSNLSYCFSENIVPNFPVRN